MSPDEEILYVADLSSRVYELDVATGQCVTLAGGSQAIIRLRTESVPMPRFNEAGCMVLLSVQMGQRST